jgi:hypothetical protein
MKVYTHFMLDRLIFNGRLAGLQMCLIKLKKKKETQPKFELRVVFE